MNSARNWWVTPFLAVLATIIVANVACQAVAVALTSAQCGSPAVPYDFFSGLFYAVTGSPDAYTVAPGCTFPAVPVRILDIVVLILVIAGAIAGGMLWARYRQSDDYFVRELRVRRGFARSGEVSRFLSRRAILRRAKTVRPQLADPVPTDLGWKLGRSAGLEVFIPITDSMVLETPPRSGRADRILIAGILDWSGPLVTTSTNYRTLRATRTERAKRGTVTIFDPQGISGEASAMRISPIAGCEDPIVADRRAQAIVAGTTSGAAMTDVERSGVVSRLLARLLHAAALGGGTVDDLLRWGSGFERAADAVATLREQGAWAWADELDSVLKGDPMVAGQNWLGVSATLRPLSFPHIRAALSPEGGRPFDPQEFLAGENTLYLIGTGAGAGASGAFLGALLDDVVAAANAKATGALSSRLDLPLALVLDDIANMFTWRGLPRMMADGGMRGICPLIVLHALTPAETAWSQSTLEAVWDRAAAKVLLGGASNVDRLKVYEALLGSRRLRRYAATYSQSGASTSEQYERVPLMRVDEIRRMPDTSGLLAYDNHRPVLLDLRDWTGRTKRATTIDRRAIKAEEQRRFLEQMQRTAAAMQSEAERP